MLENTRSLLIIGGGIAAYKCLDLIRRLRERGADVTPVMTSAAAEFVTPIAVSALAGNKVHSALFDLTAEAEMGHIELSRSADLIVVAPATADLMAKMVKNHIDALAKGFIDRSKNLCLFNRMHDSCVIPRNHTANSFQGAVSQFSRCQTEGLPNPHKLTPPGFAP